VPVDTEPVATEVSVRVAESLAFVTPNTSTLREVPVESSLILVAVTLRASESSDTAMSSEYGMLGCDTAPTAPTVAPTPARATARARSSVVTCFMILTHVGESREVERVNLSFHSFEF